MEHHNHKAYDTELPTLPDEAPIESQLCTVVWVKNGQVIQAKNKTAKRAIFDDYCDGDLLLCAWTGNWSTTVFELPLKRLLEV